jgi:hypothetical protein
LRPNIKLEITAFEPVSQVVTLPLRTILDRMVNPPTTKRVLQSGLQALLPWFARAARA